LREVVSHLILTLDGVAVFDAVVDTIARLRDTKEVLDDFFSRVAEEDAMLLGARTYSGWADYWPTSTVEPFASHINSVPKFVCSNSLRTAPWGPWGEATVLRGDLVGSVAALKRSAGKRIGVHGSPRLVESLLHADLLDELRLEIYPVVAGCGARLFREERPTKHMRLVGSRVTGNGVVIVTYRPMPARTRAQDGEHR
jgi:dihydrofolate reductase